MSTIVDGGTACVHGYMGGVEWCERGDFVRVSELKSWSFLGSTTTTCCCVEEEDDDWSADDDDDGNDELHLVIDNNDLGVAKVAARNEADEEDDADGVMWNASTATEE